MIGKKSLSSKDRGKMNLVVASKAYVNEVVRPYFKEFGAKKGHTLMERKRMKEIFLWALDCPNLSDENKCNVKEWLQEYGKSN